MFSKDKNHQYLLMVMAIVSLVLHLLFYFLIQYHFPTPLPQKDVVEFEYQDSQKKQFVTETEALKEKVEELKRKAQFLSKKYQRVKKQTKASRSGETINKLTQKPPQKNQKKKSKPSPAKIYSKSEISKLEKKLSSPPRQFNVGPSSISEHIPGVDAGHFTALDSDPFTYYGFYSRVHTQIRNRWVPKVVQIAEEVTPSELKRLSQKPRYTIIEVILDKDGYFKDALILKSSSYDYLDQAAIAPFKEASPLLNPPKELMDKDGLIRIKYGFYLNWHPRRVILR